MTENDKPAFGEMLSALYDLHGRQFKPAALMLWWNILEKYELADIQRALSQVAETSEYLPKPAEVIDIIDPSQWPSPAEAWSTYPHDERDTGAVCDETQAAWASAEGLWEQGDTIGARRAFEGAYQRHMEEARRSGRRRPVWRMSLGWDAERREQGLREAEKRGLIGKDQKFERYLPHDQSTQTAHRAGLRPIGQLLGWADGRGAAGNLQGRTGAVEGGQPSGELAAPGVPERAKAQKEGEGGAGAAHRHGLDGVEEESGR